MQNWNGSIGPVTVRSVHGHIWTFPTLTEAARWIARSGHRIVEHVPASLAETPLWVGTTVATFDECGLPVPVWRVMEAGQGIEIPHRSFALWARGAHAYDHDRDFRKAPVPGVRKRRWGRFYRRVRTQGEIRDLVGLEAELADLEEFPVRVRIRGRRKNLPTAWDDIMVFGKGRGWKHHRRTQWK
jgi:hypothetical protein